MSIIDAKSKAIEIAVKYGGIDGAHHKDWVIDQMVRALCGSTNGESTTEYESLVNDATSGEDGPNTYFWEVGIPP